MSEPLEVNTKSSQYYPVLIGTELNEEIRSWFAMNSQADRAVAVTDANVRNLHRGICEEMFNGVFKSIEWYEMPSGEDQKNIGNWQSVIDFALENSVRRNTPLLAIGGGVTGDLAGFAAATILRGIPLYHFPTTLLAMVDSAIGGKTGVNHQTGKNLIGSFYQPSAVFVQTAFLNTLPEREWLCGLGEVIKYAAISNPDLFDQAAELLHAPEWHHYSGLRPLIRECIAIKADIVQKDEKESGIRARLNLGHTFAHALEAVTGYQRFSHGEAVYIGLLAAAHMSLQRGARLDIEKLTYFREFYRLSTADLIPRISDIIPYMFKDKKILTKHIRFVLLRHWGESYICDSAETGQIHNSLKYALETADVG